MNRVGAHQFVRAVPMNAVGEDLDRAPIRRQFIGQAGQQGFDAADIRGEALGGDGDQ